MWDSNPRRAEAQFSLNEIQISCCLISYVWFQQDSNLRVQMHNRTWTDLLRPLGHRTYSVTSRVRTCADLDPIELKSISLTTRTWWLWCHFKSDPTTTLPGGLEPPVFRLLYVLLRLTVGRFNHLSYGSWMMLAGVEPTRGKCPKQLQLGSCSPSTARSQHLI